MITFFSVFRKMFTENLNTGAKFDMKFCNNFLQEH